MGSTSKMLAYVLFNGQVETKANVLYLKCKKLKISLKRVQNYLY